MAKANKTKKRKIKNKKHKKHKLHIGGKIVGHEFDRFYGAIDYIRQQTYGLEHEICGSIKQNRSSPKYTVYLHETKPLDITRANCLYDDYNDGILWHNHPIGEKYYPSLEDILKVIKNKPINMSLIFSKFGYWIIESKQHIKTTEVLENLSVNIKNINDTFYWETKKGREYNYDEINKMLQAINNICQDFINISFVNWSDFYSTVK